jgi:hypothetical protein
VDQRGGVRGHPKAIVEQLRGPMDAMRANAAGRKLDRQRNAIESAADPGDDQGFSVGQLCAIATRCGSFHEKLGSRVLECFRSGQTGIFGWIIQRVQQVDMFAFDP